MRAAANLLFLSRHRRQLERGIAIQSEAPGLAEFEELSYRRADESGAATGAFNLGAMLHQQGDTAGALAAYERAERRGDPDAAFNLGVLLYEVGDLDGAEGAWRRSVGRGHARAAENLEFLLRHRHELETAGVAGGAGDEQMSDAQGHRRDRARQCRDAVATACRDRLSVDALSRRRRDPVASASRHASTRPVATVSRPTCRGRQSDETRRT